jgi:hypothetical protein
LGVPVANVIDTSSGIMAAFHHIRVEIGSTGLLVTPLLEVVSTIIALISSAASVRSTNAVWIGVFPWIALFARSIDIEVLISAIAFICNAHKTLIIRM